MININLNKLSAKKLTQWRPGITTYFSLMNLTLLSLIIPTISIFFFYQISSFRDTQLDRTIKLMQDNLKQHGIATTHSLSLSVEQAIAGYDYTFINDLFNTAVVNNQELVYVMVIDDKGAVMAHDQMQIIGKVINDDLSRQALAILNNDFKQDNVHLPTSEKIMFKTVSGKVKVNGLDVPILEVVMPVHNGSNLAGALRYGLSMQGLTDEIKQTKWEWDKKMSNFKTMFLSITVVFFILGILISAFFTRFFIKSTTALSGIAHRVTEGDLTCQISSREMICREFVNFANVFNEMTRRLRVSLDELDLYSRSLEQKVEERTRELRDTQAELLQQAHEAGMAEMAVGVLHNIGNAITPAKVDASLLQRRLRDSAIRNSLPGAVKQIQFALDNPGQLSVAQKERLSAILTLLPEGVKEEYDLAIAELSKISAKHEHIEGIITLQMRYARLIGNHEKINLNLVVEDALTMLADTMTRRDVSMDKKLGKIPMIEIEQAKMIQIVINLLKNGYEAMDDPDLTERRLIVSTSFEPDEPAHVVLSVRDTGIGFEPENSKKLFQFGYTTKKSGSGFGLHSCANFLIAHNGSLVAYSEGTGRGAEFVAKLPAILEDQ